MLDYSNELSLPIHLIDSLSSSISSVFVGLVISFSFAAGCALTVVLLNHKASVANAFHKFGPLFGWTPKTVAVSEDCDVCGVIKCSRHLAAPNREPWRGLFITKELDDALDSVSEP